MDHIIALLLGGALLSCAFLYIYFSGHVVCLSGAGRRIRTFSDILAVFVRGRVKVPDDGEKKEELRQGWDYENSVDAYTRDIPGT